MMICTAACQVELGGAIAIICLSCPHHLADTLCGPSAPLFWCPLMHNTHWTTETTSRSDAYRDHVPWRIPQKSSDGMCRRTFSRDLNVSAAALSHADYLVPAGSRRCSYDWKCGRKVDKLRYDIAVKLNQSDVIYLKLVPNECKFAIVCQCSIRQWT